MCGLKLPNMLEIFLKTMTDHYLVASWNIYGGKKLSTLTIRFDTSAIDNNVEPESVKYKRISHQQLQRDSDRTIKWKSSLVNKDNVVGMDDNCDKNTGEINSNTDESVEITHTDQRVKHEGSSIIQPHTSCSSNNIGHTGEQEFNEPLINNCQQTGGQLDSIGVGDLHNSDNDTDQESHTGGDQESDTGGDHFSCDGCGCYWKQRHGWYRCTECGDFDICSRCYAKHFHQHHKLQMHTFVEPDSPELGFCDSCGYQFRQYSPTFKVAQCATCEDYALCKRCAQEGMHKRHSDHLQLISAKEYLDIIGWIPTMMYDWGVYFQGNKTIIKKKKEMHGYTHVYCFRSNIFLIKVQSP